MQLSWGQAWLRLKKCFLTPTLNVYRATSYCLFRNTKTHVWSDSHRTFTTLATLNYTTGLWLTATYSEFGQRVPDELMFWIGWISDMRPFFNSRQRAHLGLRENNLQDHHRTSPETTTNYLIRVSTWTSSNIYHCHNILPDLDALHAISSNVYRISLAHLIRKASRERFSHTIVERLPAHNILPA